MTRNPGAKSPLKPLADQAGCTVPAMRNRLRRHSEAVAVAMGPGDKRRRKTKRTLNVELTCRTWSDQTQG